jgi:hypothetical protein
MSIWILSAKASPRLPANAGRFQEIDSISIDDVGSLHGGGLLLWR